MGLREQDIISEARITLNDINKQTWTDKRLFKLLDNAQQEICREIPLITRKVTLNTFPGQEEYRLPSDCIKVLTARSGGRSLTTISMEELDRNNPEWEDVTSSQYSNLVVNNLTQHVVRPYPLMTEGYEGINLAIKLRCSAKPILLGYVETETTTDTEEELVIEEMWDYALTQYVISKAFIDYGDASALSRAEVANALFLAVVGKAAKLSKKSFSKRVITTGYQGRVANTNNGEDYGRSNIRY